MRMGPRSVNMSSLWIPRQIAPFPLIPNSNANVLALMRYTVHNVLLAFQKFLQCHSIILDALRVQHTDDFLLRLLYVVDGLAEVDAFTPNTSSGLSHNRPLVPLARPVHELF